MIKNLIPTIRRSLYPKEYTESESGFKFCRKIYSQFHVGGKTVVDGGTTD